MTTQPWQTRPWTERERVLVSGAPMPEDACQSIPPGPIADERPTWVERVEAERCKAPARWVITTRLSYEDGEELVIKDQEWLACSEHVGWHLAHDGEAEIVQVRPIAVRP